MILIKEQSEFTIKHIEYDLLKIIIRGLNGDKSRLQNNVNLLIAENMTSENNEPHCQSVINYLKNLINEIEKIIKDYEAITF